MMTDLKRMLPLLVPTGIVAAGGCENASGNGMGGSGGIGGVGGGTNKGACESAANVAVYENLAYTDEDGKMFTGRDAASAIGIDCMFGAETSEPPLEGCTTEVLAVLNCFPNCADEVIPPLATCVAGCTEDATGLSTECSKCTGDATACLLGFCTNLCLDDTNAPACIECRCNNNCFQSFDACSGLPSAGECQ